MCKLLLLCFAALFSGTLAKVAPDYIVKCPGLKSDCLKKTVQEVIPLFTKGIPSIDVRPIDPLFQEKARLELPGSFKVELTNGTVTGLRKCVVDSVSYANGAADMQLTCNVTIRGKYKAKGNILIVSINGEGDAKIKSTNIHITAKLKFKDVERDGVVYYEIDDYKVDYKYGGRVSFALTNLFQGNPALSEAVLQFLNQNWQQVSEEFGGPIFNKIVEDIFKAVKKFFEKIPKGELFG